MAGTNPTAVDDTVGGTGVNVFYVGANGAIWQLAVTKGAWPNHQLGGTVKTGTSPTAIEDTLNEREVFYVDATSGEIKQLWVHNVSWQISPIGGTTTVTPSAIGDNDQ